MALYISLLLISVLTIVYFSFHIVYYVLRVIFIFNTMDDRLNIDEVRRILRNHSNYYNLLPASKKSKFEQRVISFADDMDFEGRKGLRVTTEMKVLISACAVQLTFGLRKYKLKNYLNILVYPEEFYSQAIGRKVKGGV